MRVHRLVSILLLVESRGKIKAKELAQRLETSVRTIYRDVDVLCEAGIPLVSSTGPNGGIYFMEGYSVDINDLNADDIVNLYLSGIGVKPDRQSDMALKLNNALLKLQNKLPEEQGKNLNKIKEKFYFDDNPWWGEPIRLCNIDMLMKAVLQSQKLNITYKKVKGELSLRTIYPYGIIVKRTDWYLIAFCEKSNDIRTFKCERIIEADAFDEEFTIPRDFCLSEYWNKSNMAFKNACIAKENYPVTIKIPKQKSHILKGCEIIEMEEEQDFFKVIINMFQYELAIEEIIGMIGFAEVLSPAELRSYVKCQLSHMTMKYSIS